MAAIGSIPANFDIRGRADRANVDISSPRLDPRKDLFEDEGRTIGRSEFEPGDTIYYRIVMTNSGDGDAYGIVFEDDLGNDAGVNRMVIDPDSIAVVSPAGLGAPTCVLAGTVPEKMTCSFAGPLTADPDGPGGVSGGQIVVEYAATPLPSSRLLSPLSFDPWEPDLIRNTVDAVDYTEVPNPGPDDNHFTAGQSVTRARIHTPVANVEVNWVVSGANTCPASVGAGRDALLQIDLVNGDKYTRNSNGTPVGLVHGFQNWPVEDLDADGRTDKGGLYTPRSPWFCRHRRITSQA